MGHIICEKGIQPDRDKKGHEEIPNTNLLKDGAQLLGDS